MLDESFSLGEFRVQPLGWERARRFVVVRELLHEGRHSIGRKLLDVPGYTFRLLVTSRSDASEEIWRAYNRRADMENRIAELKHTIWAPTVSVCKSSSPPKRPSMPSCCGST